MWLRPGSGSGIRKNRACDRDALPLPSGQAHAALSDDRVVLLFERLDELVAVRDSADGLDLFEACVRASPT